jgi:hypothetical protein
MSDERQDQNTEDTSQAAAAAAAKDELEDLSPLENESDSVTGGSGVLGWNRVKNYPGD